MSNEKSFYETYRERAKEGWVKDMYGEEGVIKLKSYI